MKPRSMLFVDGENLTIRYQSMLQDGRIALPCVVHVEDTLVWSPRITRSQYEYLDPVIRVHYYTSVVGDEVRVGEIETQLASQPFSSGGRDEMHNGQLVPVVFKKARKSRKTRNVDINIIIDIMRYSFSDAIDRVYLASGDGDYLPLIQEVMRRGKQVELLAFSSGLNPSLRKSVDAFHSLDDKFFKEG